jgi:hypothetical protein
VIPNLNLLASLIQQQRGAPGQPLVQPGMQPMEQGLLDEEEQGFPDMRAEDPDFLRYQMMPLDEQQAQLQRQMQAADALMQGSGRQHTTPLGAAIGGLADVVRMGVGGYRMGGLQQKMDVLGQQRSDLIEQVGKGPSTLRRAMQKAPADTSIREGYLNLAREREERLKEQAGELEEYRKELTTLKKTGAAAAAARRTKAEGEKKTQGGIKLEGDLRKEFQGLPAYKNYQTASVAYEQMQSAANDSSGASDIALVTNYMRSLDPETGVKETEFRNAQNAGGFDDKARAAYTKIMSGEFLTPKMRQELLRSARSNVAALKRPHDSALKRYEELATSYSVDPKRVAAPGGHIALDEPPTGPTALPPSPGGVVGPGDPRNIKATQEIDGKRYVLRGDGNWYEE